MANFLNSPVWLCIWLFCSLTNLSHRWEGITFSSSNGLGMVVAKEHVTRRLNAGAAPKVNRVLTYLLEKNCYVTVEMRRHDRSECARIGEASPSLKQPIWLCQWLSWGSWLKWLDDVRRFSKSLKNAHSETHNVRFIKTLGCDLFKEKFSCIALIIARSYTGAILITSLSSIDHL